MHHSKHWLSFFALEGLEQVSESLQSLSHLPTIRISDYHLEHGRFSLLLLSRAINSFRQSYSTPIELFRLDFPGHNYQEMIRITAEEPESYTKCSDCYTYFTQGFYMGRLHPDKSIALHVASHILTGIAVRAPAPDTFYPSASSNLEIRNARKQQAIQDLVAFLRNKHAELIDEGRIYFDVMGRLAEGNNFRSFIDKVLYKAIDLQILPEKFRSFGFRTHYWEKEEIFTALEEVKEILDVVSYKETEVIMPQYQQYLQDQDKLKYANDFALFWKMALNFSLRYHFKAEFTDLEYKSIIEKLLELIITEFVSDPPICQSFSHHVLLKRIK